MTAIQVSPELRTQLEGQLEVLERALPALVHARTALESGKGDALASAQEGLGEAARVIPRLGEAYEAIERRARSESWALDAPALRLMAQCREEVRRIQRQLSRDLFGVFGGSEHGSPAEGLARLSQVAPHLTPCQLPRDAAAKASWALAVAPALMLVSLVSSFHREGFQPSQIIFLAPILALLSLAVSRLLPVRARFRPASGALELSRFEIARSKRRGKLVPGESSISVLPSNGSGSSETYAGALKYWAARIDPPGWTDRAPSPDSFVVGTFGHWPDAREAAEKLARTFSLPLRQFELSEGEPSWRKLDVRLAPDVRLVWKPDTGLLALNGASVPFGRRLRVSVLPAPSGTGWQLRFEPLEGDAPAGPPGAIEVHTYPSRRAAMMAAQKVNRALGAPLRLYAEGLAPAAP